MFFYMYLTTNQALELKFSTVTTLFTLYVHDICLPTNIAHHRNRAVCTRYWLQNNGIFKCNVFCRHTWSVLCFLVGVKGDNSIKTPIFPHCLVSIPTPKDLEEKGWLSKSKLLVSYSSYMLTPVCMYSFYVSVTISKQLFSSFVHFR